MSEINAEAMQSKACRRAFAAMMWAFQFWVVLPPLHLARGTTIEPLPDAVGWLIFLIALRAIAGLDPGVRQLRRLAVAGLVLCVPRVVRFQPSEILWQHIYLLLSAAGSVVAVVFVWKLCSLIADMAERADKRSLAQSARFGRWLYPMASVFLYWFICRMIPLHLRDVPALTKAIVMYGILFIFAAVICAMMGLMASVARMCREFAEAPPREAQQTDADAEAPPPA